MSAPAAGAPVRYLVLGDTHATTLRTSLVGCVARWREHWAPSGAAAAHIELHLQGQTPLLACGGHSRAMRMTAAGMPVLDILTGVDVLGALVGLSTQDGAGPLLLAAEHRELAEELRAEILRSLAQSLATAAALRDVGIEAAPTTFAESVRRAAGERRICASVSFARPGTHLLMFIAPALVERLLPRRAVPAEGALERAAKAIDEGLVYVEALLGQSEITLRELASLVPGDVVILDVDLAHGGRLEVRGQPFAQAALGRIAELRAVRVAGFKGSACT